MLKKLFIGLTIALAIGSALVFAGYLINSSNPNTNSNGALQKDTLNLDAFENIDITVTSANISIVRGDVYQIDYVLHAVEEIKTIEVKNNTLVFDSDYIDKEVFNFNFNFFKFPSFSDISDLTTDEEHKIVITIPQDAKLSDISLASVSGNIIINDEDIANLNLDTVSGKITTQNLTAQTLIINAVSSNVDVTDCIITDFSSNAVSSNTTLTGDFENITISTVSGHCEIEGIVSNSANINTMSGDIDIDTNIGAVNANTFGDIRYNGENQGATFSTTDGESDFNINTTSGDITIDME